MRFEPMRFSAILTVCLAAACGPPTLQGSPADPARSPAAIEGEVLGVDRVAPVDHLASGVQLRIQPGSSEAVVIDLAPDWYLTKRGISFAKSERVRVEGSRVEQRGTIVIYATRVRKGDQTVELRDPSSGKPLWEEPAR